MKDSSRWALMLGALVILCGTVLGWKWMSLQAADLCPPAEVIRSVAIHHDTTEVEVPVFVDRVVTREVLPLGFPTGSCNIEIIFRDTGNKVLATHYNRGRLGWLAAATNGYSGRGLLRYRSCEGTIVETNPRNEVHIFTLRDRP